MRSLFTVLVLALATAPLTAQVVQRPAADILAFEIEGITVTMAPDDARETLLGAGFEKEGRDDDWGMVPTGSFRNGDAVVAITHRDGLTGAVVITVIDSEGDLGSPGAHSHPLRPHGGGCARVHGGTTW